MTAPSPDLFPGPAKRRVLAALIEAGGPIYAADLCETVFGDREQRNRDTLRNLVAQMRPKLQAHGFDIRGRKDLRINAYQLVNTLLGG